MKGGVHSAVGSFDIFFFTFTFTQVGGDGSFAFGFGFEILLLDIKTTLGNVAGSAFAVGVEVVDFVKDVTRGDIGLIFE